MNAPLLFQLLKTDLDEHWHHYGVPDSSFMQSVLSRDPEISGLFFFTPTNSAFYPHHVPSGAS